MVFLYLGCGNFFLYLKRNSVNGALTSERRGEIIFYHFKVSVCSNMKLVWVCVFTCMYACIVFVHVWYHRECASPWLPTKKWERWATDFGLLLAELSCLVSSTEGDPAC